MSYVNMKNNISQLFRITMCHLAAAIAVAGILAVGSTGTRAATSVSPPTAALTSVGSVDLQKVLNGYTKKSATETDMKNLIDQYNSVFTVQKANPMLSVADQQTLGSLLLKPLRTPADEAQVKTLENKSQSDASELVSLQQKTTPTDADKARLATLSQEQQAGAQALQTVHDNYSSQIDARNQQQVQALTTEVKAAVAAVAQQRGLSVVFDSSLAIYAANDVTQLVINRLNSGK